jgi:hypothetical protein
MGGQAPDGSVHPSDLYIGDTSAMPLVWRKAQLASNVVPEARFSFGMQPSGSTIFVSAMLLVCTLINRVDLACLRERYVNVVNVYVYTYV